MSLPIDLPEDRSPQDFRLHLRARALAAREALPDTERRRLTAAVCANLTPLLARLAPRSLAFCWPYRGEADVTGLVADWLAEDERRVAALPVVPGPAAPLQFVRWRPGEALREGAFGIPIPEACVPASPDLVLVPLNAFDAQGFRIGYGGGYFDRTLAAANPAPCTVGVGFELGRVDSIRPAAHDRPLDWLVTEAGVFYCHQGGGRHLNAPGCGKNPGGACP